MTTFFGVAGSMIIAAAVVVIAWLLYGSGKKVAQAIKPRANREDGLIGLDQQVSIREMDRNKVLVPRRQYRVSTANFGRKTQKRLSRQKILGIRLEGAKPYIPTRDGRLLRVAITSNGDRPMHARTMNEYGNVHGRNFVPEAIHFV